MERVPEPELMEEAEQARAYAEADFAEPNALFVRCFAERFPGFAAPGGRAVDLGCGPADVTIRFARAHPDVAVVGVDGAPAMLAWAARAIERAGLTARIELVRARLPDVPLPGEAHAALLSNSLLHHLPDPAVLWRTVRRLGAPGAAVAVMDLARPADEQAARTVVETYAADAPEILRRDFLCSLRAAFTPDEVRAQLRAAGLAGFAVELVSDRHLYAWGRLGG